MNQLLSIVDDTLVIKKLSVETLDGPIQTTDDVRIQGNIFVERDIKAKRNIEVSGVLTVDTLKVKNFITENTPTIDPAAPVVNPDIKYTFAGKTEKNLDGQGLIWLDGQTGSKQFVYKEGDILWSTMNIELLKDKSFRINKVNVLSSTELGPTVTTSSLRKVGELENLRVSGQMVVDGWAFFNSYANSLGLNTDSPNGTLGVVVENGVEVIIGAKDNVTATIGTFTHNTLDLITDNKTRVSIKESGDVIFGNPKFKNAVVKIHGKLEVDEIISGSEKGGLQPLVFKSNDEAKVYGTGIIWNHENKLRSFLYAQDPDRILSTEVIDLVGTKWFSIDTNLVLSKTTLGSTVTESNLQSLGQVRELEVIGHAKFTGETNISNLTVSQISNEESFSVCVGGEEDIRIQSGGDIVIGTEDNTNRNIRVWGMTSLLGGMRLNNKRIITGASAPKFGRWYRGEICYNEEPIMEGYVGWVCVETGEPGRWCPFGLIMPVRG